MAPSKITVAFLLAFAVVAATLHPSAAARLQQDDAAAAADQGGSSAQAPPFWHHRPLPPLPPFPCIPGMPRFRFLPPCSNDSSTPIHPIFPPLPRPVPLPPSPPAPAECHTSLSGLASPCADFLTNASATAAPAAACCDGLKSLVSGAPICMCHVVNGDFGKLLPAPMLRLRMMALPRVCRLAMPFGTLRNCIRGPVPPMDATPAGSP